MDPDAIVIGSGFGGAFAADQLVDRGLRVLMVERGPWRDTAPMRAAGVGPRSPLPHGANATKLVRQVSAPGLPAAGLRVSSEGLFDLHVDRDMAVLCSSGVGGGSHAYTAMNTRPASPSYWSDHADGVEDQAMDVLYESAIQRMGARRIQAGEGVPNAIVDRLGPDDVLRAPAELDQPPMSFRTDGGRTLASNAYFGSADGSKVTLDELLLAPALGRGLEIADRSEAVEFGPVPGGWRVTVRCERTGSYRHVEAPRLLLGAGTMNTLRLLFAARAAGAIGALPALGHRLSGNGDLLGFWACNHAGADYSLGTPCHGRFSVSDSDEDADLFLGSFGYNGIDELPLPKRVRERLKRDILFVGMGADGANGTAAWRRGRLRLSYSTAANPVLHRIGDAFRQVERASGQRVRLLGGPTLTVHLVGGARTAGDPSRGVVDEVGMVHGHPGLHVLDASVLPAAPGTPPSMSIAAWALHVAGHIAGGPPSVSAEHRILQELA